MMYSDYFLLTVCALSMVFAPFMVIAQLRFAHVLQAEGYSNIAYFSWVRKHFASVYVPLAGICLVVFAAERMMRAFLANTSFYQQQIFITYIVVTLALMAALALVFYRYTQSVKIEGDGVPVRCEGRLLPVFWTSCALLAVLFVLVNMFTEIDELIFFLPLFTPLLAPLANAIPARASNKAAQPELELQMEQNEGE